MGERRSTHTRSKSSRELAPPAYVTIRGLYSPSRETRSSRTPHIFPCDVNGTGGEDLSWGLKWPFFSFSFSFLPFFFIIYRVALSFFSDTKKTWRSCLQCYRERLKNEERKEKKNTVRPFPTVSGSSYVIHIHSTSKTEESRNAYDAVSKWIGSCGHTERQPVQQMQCI